MTGCDKSKTSSDKNRDTLEPAGFEFTLESGMQYINGYRRHTPDLEENREPLFAAEDIIRQIDRSEAVKGAKCNECGWIGHASQVDDDYMPSDMGSTECLKWACPECGYEGPEPIELASKPELKSAVKRSKTDG